MRISILLSANGTFVFLSYCPNCWQVIGKHMTGAQETRTGCAPTCVVGADSATHYLHASTLVEASSREGVEFAYPNVEAMVPVKMP